MKCIDEPYKIYGDFNTNIASSLVVVLERCDPAKRKCASEATVKEWFKFKYLIVADNEQNYI